MTQHGNLQTTTNAEFSIFSEKWHKDWLVQQYSAYYFMDDNDCL